MSNWLFQLLVFALGMTQQSLADAEAKTEQVFPASFLNPAAKAQLISALDSEDDLFWVVAVLDGDTILVSDKNRELFQVRLLAVDTNEINGPDSSAECYGHQAALFTMDFLQDRAVRLRRDPANEDLDPLGRKLRYVDALQPNGTFKNLNKALIEEGYASFPRQYPVTSPNTFISLENQAKQNNSGLWNKCSA